MVDANKNQNIIKTTKDYIKDSQTQNQHKLNIATYLAYLARAKNNKKNTEM